MASSKTQRAYVVAALAAPLLLFLSPWLPNGIDLFPFAIAIAVTGLGYRAGVRASFIYYAASGWTLAALVLAFQGQLMSALSAAFADSAWIVAACGLGVAIASGMRGTVKFGALRPSTRSERIFWIVASAASPALVWLAYAGWTQPDPPATFIPTAIGIVVAAVGFWRGARATLVAYAVAAWLGAAALLTLDGGLSTLVTAGLADVAYVAAACAALAGVLFRPRDLPGAR